MKKINKNSEPNSLTNFKINHPSLKYSDLNNNYSSIRTDIRESCLEEQFYLCGYCCNRINITSSHNEHIIAQSVDDSKTLDYTNNIIVSCNSQIHCGHYKENNSIAITPLMDECEKHFTYNLNGKITHYDQNSQRTIDTLGLRNKSLIEKRKQIIDTVLFSYGYTADTIELTEQEDIELMILYLSEPDKNGKLEAFAPILVSILEKMKNQI